MALQWIILSYVVAVEAAIALLLTLPAPKLLKSRVVSLISILLQPAMGIVPFAAFQLLGLFLVPWSTLSFPFLVGLFSLRGFSF
uniref:Endoplasmic reticulum transmembrane protein n=1 Tax=Nelumbo nucifera TaxID=4432 RepID=A0A822YN16_NELNU|nr:TPA_asm: hypothetical protein HUJ06_011147 [Nelumbo nucifera]